MPQTYPLDLPTLRLTIGGTVRTSELLSRTLVVSQILGAQVDTCQFSLKSPERYRGTATTKPQSGESVLVEVQTGSGAYETLFSGYVTRSQDVRIANAVVKWDVECVDHTALLRRFFVTKTYVNQTVSDIVIDAVRQFAPAIDVDTNVTASDVVVARITFSRQYVADVVQQMAALVGFEWYVDSDKSLHFYDPTSATYASTLAVNDTSQNFMDLSIEPQLDQVRNRVYVEGGNALSAEITEQYDANGDKAVFELGHSNVVAEFLVSGGVSQRFMAIDGVPQRVGLQGQVDEAGFSGGFLLDDAKGIVYAAKGTDLPANGARIVFRYKWLVPVAVMREDFASQYAVAVLAGEDYTSIVELDSPLHWWQMVSPQGTTIEGNQGSTGYGAIGGGAIQQTAAGTIERRIPGALYPPTPITQLATNENVAARFLGGYYQTGSGLQVPQSAYTIEAWVQPERGNTTKGIAGAWANDSANHNGAMLWITPSGTYANAHGGSIGNWIIGCNPESTPSYGYRWDHVVSVWDGATLSLRVNNQVVGTRSVGTAPGRVVNSGMQIGQFYGDIGGVTGGAGFVGGIDEVAVYDVALTSTQIAAHYAAGRMAGVREYAVVDNSITSFPRARQLGDSYLDKYGNVITDVRWSSFVPGWQVGTTVPINVTKSGTGRVFVGDGLIQDLTIRALGAQRLLYDVHCVATRFNALDYQRKLAEQGDVVGAVSVLNVISADEAAVIAVGGSTTATSAAPPYVVAPDWGTPNSPQIVAGFWQLASGIVY